MLYIQALHSIEHQSTQNIPDQPKKLKIHITTPDDWLHKYEKLSSEMALQDFDNIGFDISPGDCERAPIILHQMPLNDTTHTYEYTLDNSPEEDGILIDLYFNLRMDKVLSVIDYLKEKGYLDRNQSIDNLNTVNLSNILIPIKTTHHVKQPLIRMKFKSKSIC